jgi:signal transduction histidine kinase
VSDSGGGLRLRLFLGLLGAALLSLAVLSVAMLLLVRDGLYARRMADAREHLRSVSAALAARCPAGQGGVDVACLERGADVLQSAGVRLLPAGACAQERARVQGRALVCEEAGAGAALEVAVDLAGVRDQLRALDARLSAAVAAALALLVLLSAWSVERGVVRRLSPIDEALGQIGQSASNEPVLLSEGGDALGRLGSAVNRLVERLREERARTQQQIVSLQAANRRLAEEQRALREAREDLARSERLATVGRLAAGVAHEVGNPLTAIIGYAAILRNRLPAGHEAGEYAERVEREAARMDRILRDLLDLARPREVEPGPIDLAQVLRQAHALVAPQPSWAACSLEVEIPGDLPRALGVEHYAVQVLVNLLLNSAKARARRVHVRGFAEDGYVQLDVADDGEGIPQASFARLFEPFFTSAQPGEGTGLGLALCHASMERIGGSIAAVRRPPGDGAQFTLRFRAAPGATGPGPRPR